MLSKAWISGAAVSLVMCALAGADDAQHAVGIPSGRAPADLVTNINEAYSRKIEQCRDLFSAHQYRQAEVACKGAMETAEKLPAERTAERIDAYEYVGYSLFEQKKFKKSLKFFRQELDLAEKTLHPDDAELGHTCHAMAQGLHAIGDLRGARSFYQRSIRILNMARQHRQSHAQKVYYATAMKEVLQEYSQVLRESGDATGAQAAEQRANALQ